jgi:hypothetical protein
MIAAVDSITPADGLDLVFQGIMAVCAVVGVVAHIWNNSKKLTTKTAVISIAATAVSAACMFVSSCFLGSEYPSWFSLAFVAVSLGAATWVFFTGSEPPSRISVFILVLYFSLGVTVYSVRILSDVLRSLIAR